MNLFRLNHDRTVAIDNEVSFYPMGSCPTGVKVQLHTEGGVAIYGVIKEQEDAQTTYLGWRPVPAGVKDAC